MDHEEAVYKVFRIHTLWCPKCHGAECFDECDNDCGTKVCDCGADFYMVDGQPFLGHNPECGYDLDGSE